MKILLTTLNSKYTHINIALYYLKNKIKNICDVETLNLNINEDLNNVLSKILKHNSDSICFGVYIWNIEQTLKIANSIKQIKPDIIISFGGPEVSYNPNEILEKYSFVDTVMCLESENNIVKFVDDLKNNTLQKIYNIKVNSKDVPSISNDLVENYDDRAIYFETSRGCPFRCSYCLSCINKNIKYFNISHVKTDLKKLLDKNVMQIRFIDRTFNSNKKRAIEIWKFLIENRKNTTFHFEICASLIDEETISFLKNVPKNIFRLEIGIQSTNKETLESINRSYNFEYEKEIIKKLVGFNNLHIHTDLIIGLPFETINIFKKSFNDLYLLNTNEMQLGFLKFLKGTDIYEKKDLYEYKYINYPPYEVLQNKFMSYNEIVYLKKFENVFENVYNSKMFIESIKYLETLFTSPYELFEIITDYFIKTKLIDRKISYDEIYKNLLILFNNDIILKQTLTFDYCSNFKGTRDWMYDEYNIKEEILLYINENDLFSNMTYTDITKNYRFLTLDYDVENNKSTKKTYLFKK